MRAGLNAMGTAMILIVGVLGVIHISCPDLASAADTSSGIGVRIAPSDLLWAVDDLALPKVIEGYGQAEAGHGPVRRSGKCRAGEPVDPASLDTDRRPAAPRGKPYGISLDEAFLPISVDISNGDGANEALSDVPSDMPSAAVLISS